MRALCTALASMEDAIVTIEQRGTSLRSHAGRYDPVKEKLPPLQITHLGGEAWFFTEDEVDEYLQQNDLVLEAEVRAAAEAAEKQAAASEVEKSKIDDPDSIATAEKTDDNEVANTETADAEPADAPEEVPPEKIAILNELHEVRTINAGLKDISPLGFTIDDMIPVERTGSTTARFELIRGEDTRRSLEDLRDLLPEVRAAGEKGLQVTRFKGLGEMNAEELRETTLDPENRTLLKVNLTDAGTADEMFRLLMGDKVEPRREFIETHALEVKNLDV